MATEQEGQKEAAGGLATSKTEILLCGEEGGVSSLGEVAWPCQSLCDQEGSPPSRWVRVHLENNQEQAEYLPPGLVALTPHVPVTQVADSLLQDTDMPALGFHNLHRVLHFVTGFGMLHFN